MKRRLELLGLLALLPAMGCYSYRIIPIDDVRPDVVVRLRVKPEVSSQVSQLLGYTVDDVEGTVLTVQSDTMMLTVPGQTAVIGGSVERLYQRVQVPVSDVERVQQRHLNPAKTYTLIGLGMVGGAILATVAFNVINGSSQDQPPEVNNQLTAPLLSPNGALANPPPPGPRGAGMQLLLPLGHLQLVH
jgi:hypothetical protein